MSRRRVVVTGLGTVNPLGLSVPTFWQAALAGHSGIDTIRQFDTSAFKVHFGGEVKDFDPDKFMPSKESKRLDRFAQFALAAAQEAIKSSGLEPSKEDPFRVGVMIGSGIGGLNEFEEQHGRYKDRGPDRISPFTIPKMMPNAAAGHVSINFGFCGPCTAVSTACASAANAIGDAMRAIQFDHADVMITGGAESTITPMGLGGFVAARALSTRSDDMKGASRPFDKDRDGFVLAEGAGILILEELEHARKRNAPIIAEILGAGATADAHNITAPHPEGAGAIRAMQNALRDARLSPEDIDYVNAHGTSTPLGDAAETMAIKKLFGDHAYKLAVNSTKSLIGHTLGASGGIEAIVCALSIQHGVLHPTINYHTPDPECDLDYVPNTPRERRIRWSLSNSFGFGGHNCCLVMGQVV